MNETAHRPQRRDFYSIGLALVADAIDRGELDVEEAFPAGTCRWGIRGKDGSRRFVTALRNEVEEVVGANRMRD
jgi:hypothetical protein